MPIPQVRELRKAGRLQEAYTMALREYYEHPFDLLYKRSLAWVYYAFCKKAAAETDVSEFIQSVKGIKELELPSNDLLIADTLLWSYVKIFNNLSKETIIRYKEAYRVFNTLRGFCFTFPSEAFSALLEQLHKAFKNTPIYTFVFNESLHLLSPQDFLPKDLGYREIMPLAEQIYTAYAKHIYQGIGSINEEWNCLEYTPYKEMMVDFLPTLNQWIAAHPTYSFLPYYKAKMELFIEDEQALSNFLPFAKQQSDKMWVWQLLSEMVTDDELSFACLCKALTLANSKRFTEKIRIQLCKKLLKKKLYNEARTEIDIVLASKEPYNIPNKIAEWQEEWWYTRAVPFTDNTLLYNQFKEKAEVLLA
jgi:hypothetical protein